MGRAPAIEAACRIVILDDQLAEAQRLNHHLTAGRHHPAGAKRTFAE
ncbi:hypothetical protein [Pseudofrankia sp. BMG5.36]|nr:hypothetical protein [Pseudofrankia sp. BMG5.36]